MLISWPEVRRLERLIDSLEKAEKEAETIAYVEPLYARCIDYFARKPHLLMPLGFEEYVGFRRRDQYRHLWFHNFTEWGQTGASIFRKPSGQWLLFLWTATSTL